MLNEDNNSHEIEEKDIERNDIYRYILSRSIVFQLQIL